jgi:hypothetical protein
MKFASTKSPILFIEKNIFKTFITQVDYNSKTIEYSFESIRSMVFKLAFTFKNFINTY